MEMVITAILIGLASALHCAGMCGPLLFLFFGSAQSKKEFVSRFLLYGLGKTMAYIFLGMVVGTLGFSLRLIISQQWMSSIAGVIMLLLILFPLLSQKIGVLNGWNTSIKNQLNRFLAYRKMNYWVIGFLNGLLPCGVVYMALTASLAFGALQYNMIFMMLFGLATLPILGVIAFMKSTLRIQFRKVFTKLSTWATILIAVFLIMRGGVNGLKGIGTKSNENKALQCVMHSSF